MLIRLLHRIVAIPRVYELWQFLVGVRVVQNRMARAIGLVNSGSWVIDLGGGTGRVDALFGPTTMYVCVDIDPQKLGGFKQTRRRFALLGDVTRLPLEDQVADLVVCSLMSHHLTDPELDRLFAEAARVLKPDGAMLFCDCVWKRWRVPGRLLWAMDRGHNPRTSDRLRRAISDHMSITHWEQFAVVHEYVLALSRLRSAPQSRAS